MKKNDLEGQMNLFATDTEDVVLDTEFEDFLNVRKSRKTEKEKVEEEKTEKEKVKKEQPEKKYRPQAGDPHIVMQKSFESGSKKATVAYIDYNCVYHQDMEGKVTFLHYPDSRKAVDAYMDGIAAMGQARGWKETAEHPKMKKIDCSEYLES